MTDASEKPETFADWFAREVPPGTVISDPHWWAPRILRAVERTRPADDARDAWRPIETAPRDGTEILVAGGTDEDGNGGIALVWCERGHVKDHWTITYAEGGCVSVRYYNPTHWQPLPPPPMQKEPGRE